MSQQDLHHFTQDVVFIKGWLGRAAAGPGGDEIRAVDACRWRRFEDPAVRLADGGPLRAAQFVIVADVVQEQVDRWEWNRCGRKLAVRRPRQSRIAQRG